MHKLFSIIIVVNFIGLGLTGCARFQEVPLQAPATMLNMEARTLSDAGLYDFMVAALAKDSVWPLKSWNIDQLSLAAFYYHPDLALARAQADTVDAANMTAAQRPNPSINPSTSYLTHIATTAMPWYALGNLNIPIETAGKRGFRMDKAKHLSAAAKLRIKETAWLVRARLRLAMLETYAAQEAERLLQRQLGIQQAMSVSLEQQFSAGEITRLELMRTHLALNQLQLNSSAAQKRTAESRVLLAAAVGLPVTALSGITFDFSDLAKPPVLERIPVRDLRSIALQQRPDVLAALADYDAAQSALQLEIANQYPNVQANPGYAWELGENLWTLGALIQLPVLHQNQGPIAEAEARRHEFAVRFEALQLRILGDIDRADAGVAAVLSKWQVAEKQKQLQQDNLQSAQALLQAGEVDRLALLSTALENAIAERSHLDVLIETQQALNTLEDTLRFPLASTLTTTQISDSVLRKTSP
ncbi:TolC family protein [Methylomonas paludis]|uniref:TolC family protein n=1 Tax=Methylomonas paludis TaxID=1173101 RepID=A0A975MQW4_9GAMM|nr:TolC family protein [Methylomonas paludis]QWF72383.1 TolC family protein [Methylomonas paludis]